MSFVALLHAVKAAALTALANAGRPAPGVAYISEGDVVYDCPDALIVSLDAVAPITRNSPTAMSQWEATVGQVSVHLLRCAAPLGADSPPLPADIEAVGLGLLADLDALLSMYVGDCQPLALVSVTLPRNSGGDLAPLVLTWQAQP